MWISKRELQRLERERGNAERRALAAEERIDTERQRHDWLILQLTNRVVTKHGGYGLAETKPEPEPERHPKGFTHEPTLEDIDVLNQFKMWAAAAGQPLDAACWRRPGRHRTRRR